MTKLKPDDGMKRQLKIKQICFLKFPNHDFNKHTINSTVLRKNTETKPSQVQEII